MELAEGRWGMDPITNPRRSDFQVGDRVRLQQDPGGNVGRVVAIDPSVYGPKSVEVRWDVTPRDTSLVPESVLIKIPYR